MRIMSSIYSSLHLKNKIKLTRILRMKKIKIQIRRKKKMKMKKMKKEWIK